MRRFHPTLNRAFLGTLLLCATVASPVLAASGPHLSWDHCSADGQVGSKSFACDRDIGREVLVVSYDSPTDITGVTGCEIVVQLSATTGTLPAWWEVFGAGRCRSGALTAACAGAPGSACTDPYQGLAGCGAASLQLATPSAGSARVLAAVAVPPEATWNVVAGTEYFALRLALTYSKTTGISACAGCSVPMCLLAGTINLLGPDGLPAVRLTAGPYSDPVNGGGPASVAWQNGFVTGYGVVFERTAYTYQLGCSDGAPVPTRRGGWGAIKALWR